MLKEWSCHQFSSFPRHWLHEISQKNLRCKKSIRFSLFIFLDSNAMGFQNASAINWTIICGLAEIDNMDLEAFKLSAMNSSSTINFCGVGIECKLWNFVIWNGIVQIIGIWQQSDILFCGPGVWANVSFYLRPWGTFKISCAE